MALSSNLEDHYCGISDFLFVYMEIVKDQLNVCKSMRPGRIHPRVQSALSVTYQRFWESGKVHAN